MEVFGRTLMKQWWAFSSPRLHLSDDWHAWNCWTLYSMLNKRSFLTELLCSLMLFFSFIQYIHSINYCRQEKLVKLKSTQSVLTTAHWESLWCGWSSWFCCFGFGSSWCIFWVFDWSFTGVQSFSLCGLSREQMVCGCMSSPDFLLKSRPWCF